MLLRIVCVESQGLSHPIYVCNSHFCVCSGRFVVVVAMLLPPKKDQARAAHPVITFSEFCYNLIWWDIFLNKTNTHTWAQTASTLAAGKKIKKKAQIFWCNKNAVPIISSDLFLQSEGQQKLCFSFLWFGLLSLRYYTTAYFCLVSQEVKVKEDHKSDRGHLVVELKV